MKCPNCGGVLYFDIDSQQLKCDHCDSTFDPGTYSDKNEAEKSGRVYTCRNCGAQLITMDEEAVTYCSYCGFEAVFEGRLEEAGYPRRIIPFLISRQRCREIYENELSKKLYVPKEFKDPAFIEQFRPFYIPYWMYYVKFREDPIELKGTSSYTSGKYDYYEDYEVSAVIGEKGLYGLPFDASRNFDDAIAEDISPFTRRKMTDFKNSYLAGMYADRPNVPAKLYEDEVIDKACERAEADLRREFRNIDLKLPRSRSGRQELLQPSYSGEDAVFLPVWFLTWKKNDRVAYAVVNGQTGKIHIDLPIDVRTFLLYTLLTAAGLFVLLTLFVSVTSRFVLWFSALLVWLSGRRYCRELIEIRNRENHVFDKGYLINDEDELSMSGKAREKLRRRGKPFRGSSLQTVISGAVVMFVLSFGLMGTVYDLLVSQTGAIVMTFVILILELIQFIRSVNAARHLKNKSSVFVCFFALAAAAAAFLLAAAQPVRDWWYYAGSLFCLAAASLMCADLIRRYQEVSTRALPSFYAREGGYNNV